MIPFSLQRYIDRAVRAAVERTVIARISEAKRLSLRPDDILVVKYDGILSAHMQQSLRDSVERLFGHQRIAVTMKGVDIDVVGPEADPDVPAGNRVHTWPGDDT